jgi:hypothetical protein
LGLNKGGGSILSAVSPSQTVFSIGYDFHWQNSDNGNVFAITNFRDATRSQTFSYDALNRLTSAQNAGTNCAALTVNGKTEYWGNNYGYDAWANLTQKSITKCSADNFSVAALNNNQLTGYGYDAAGLGPTPDGRATTSGSGSQAGATKPIPVKPHEIKPLRD